MAINDPSVIGHISNKEIIGYRPEYFYPLLANFSLAAISSSRHLCL